MARKSSSLRIGTPEYAIRMAEQAVSAEKAGDRAGRDAFSRKAFTCRKVAVGNVEVETWWDNSTRSYVTYTKVDGFQVGEADYTGNKDSAAHSHMLAIASAFVKQPS